MTTQNPCRYTEECAKQITIAYSMLTLSLPDVKALFPNKGLSEVTNFYDGEELLWLEVKFDLFTLTCLFDENRICKGAFLDDLKEMVSYTDYCVQTYKYNPIVKGWIINNCHIIIEAECEEFSLAILHNKAAVST